MPDTITLARAELQQLLELVGVIEDAVEYIDDHVEDNPYPWNTRHKFGKR
jgi:hypothetical protein